MKAGMEHTKATPCRKEPTPSLQNSLTSPGKRLPDQALLCYCIKNNRSQSPCILIHPFTFAVHHCINFNVNTTDMFDMMKMMGKMKEVQTRMKEAQDKLVNIKAH